MTEPLRFCVNCRHYNKADNACDHPTNVLRTFHYDLVTGELLATKKAIRKDSSALISRAGSSALSNCGYDGEWFEPLSLGEIALKALSK